MSDDKTELPTEPPTTNESSSAEEVPAEPTAGVSPETTAPEPQGDATADAPSGTADGSATSAQPSGDLNPKERDDTLDASREGAPDDEEARKAKRKAKRAARREELRKKKHSIGSKLEMARKVALVGFSIVGAYLIAIYLDLLLKVFTLKHLDSFHPFIQRYLITPVAFEGGFFIAQILVLYLLGRFVELKLWPTLISMVVLIHAFDFGVKHVLAQAQFNYVNWRLWLLRLPLIVLTVIIGKWVLKLALIREGEA